MLNFKKGWASLILITGILSLNYFALQESSFDSFNLFFYGLSQILLACLLIVFGSSVLFEKEDDKREKDYYKSIKCEVLRR